MEQLGQLLIWSGWDGPPSAGPDSSCEREAAEAAAHSTLGCQRWPQRKQSSALHLAHWRWGWEADPPRSTLSQLGVGHHRRDGSCATRTSSASRSYLVRMSAVASRRRTSSAESSRAQGDGCACGQRSFSTCPSSTLLER